MPPSLGAESQAITINHLAAGDGQRLRALRLRALRDAPDAFGTTLEEATSWQSEVWDRQLEQFATVVATLNGTDLGLARLAAHDLVEDAGYLISMWVAPDARRRGIGSALVDAVIDLTKARRLDRLFLDVVETELPAIALYEGAGFVPNGESGTLPSPREHIREIQMVLKL